MVGYCRVETTHFLNFLIPLISMNLTNDVTLPNGQQMPSVSCGDWSVCNAAPAFMMITVTVIGVLTTLCKEALALGPSVLMTIPNMFSGMEEMEKKFILMFSIILKSLKYTRYHNHQQILDSTRYMN